MKGCELSKLRNTYLIETKSGDIFKHLEYKFEYTLISNA